VVFPQAFGFYSPSFWPTAFPPYPFYGDSSYSPTPFVEPPAAESPAIERNDALRSQVQELSQQIEQLRQELRFDPLPPTPAQTTPQPPPIPTVLVFRDGRRMEIQNYAIVGQTFWALEERVSTKIALSDLDLEATQRENRARGVRFRLPER